MNDTTPLHPIHLDLRTNSDSMIREIAISKPPWVHSLILEALNSNVVPMSSQSLRELIKFLCPAEVPEHSTEVELASRKVMRQRLQLFVHRFNGSTSRTDDNVHGRFEPPELELVTPKPIGKLGSPVSRAPRSSVTRKRRRRRGRRSIVKRLLSRGRR